MLSRTELDRLFQYCLALTGQRSDAQDLLHSTLESYLRKRPSGVDSPIAYIRRMARNRFFDELRRRATVPFESLEIQDSEPAGIESELEAMVSDALSVERIWHELSAPEREVIFLWAVEGLTVSEIALQLGEPRGTLLSRLSRLKTRLRNAHPHLVDGGRP